MPPTMIFTRSPPPPPAPDAAFVRESRQADTDKDAARASAVMAPIVRRADITGPFRVSELDVGAGRGRPPPHETAFNHREQPFGEQRDNRDDNHSGVDAGGVERALRVVDEQSKALVGAGVLADDRADDGEPE